MDLVRAVRQALEDHRAALEAGGLAVEFLAPGGPVWILGDPARIGQVVGNLLANAGKFSNRGDRLQVAVRRPAPDRAEIEVTDTGIGMDSDLLAQLFEPFFQGEATRHRSPAGLGLGLALAKGLVELHGGGIQARSAGTGQGSTFTVSLPACQGPEPAAPAPARPGPTGPGRRILVVEDNRDAALSLKLLLGFMGHRVELAHTGQEALDLARAGRPEVVLCDIGLPDLDGHAVARALRADPAGPAPYLVAMTGFGQAEDKRRALEAGFDRHLTKPADPDALVQLLDDLPRA
jgi:CheY-like chemotaxis protein